MKKRLFAVIVLVFALALCVVACNEVQFKVDFIVDDNVYSTVNTAGGETIKIPDNPTKEGYTFDGWYWDKDTWEKPFTTNSLLDAPLSSDMEVYAKWTPNTNTAYTVNHYKQKSDKSGYILFETENLTGITDTSVTPNVKSYIDFASPTKQTVNISPDGSTVVDYYYKCVTIYFGSYPQSEVTDTTLKATLNGLAGTLPTTSNSQSWTTINTDEMWYKDVTYGGEKYRGIYFTSNSYQSSNGYNTSTVYWFKFEPIKWRILTEEGGKAFLLCDMLIDSQAFQNRYAYDSALREYYIVDSNGNKITDESGNYVYANDYEYSTIRAWLNDNFYNTAFSTLEKQAILTTTVATNGTNTNDKLFLLSYSEVTNSAYGLNRTTARQKQTTDYAQCQGAYTNTGSYAGNGWWWLRSPCSDDSDYARNVFYDGDVYYNFYYYGYRNRVNYTNFGVCPALWITL